jgi:microcystin-dependent protein
MASYSYPIESSVFNDRDYIGNNDIHQPTGEFNSDLYVQKTGDVMTGALSTPNIVTDNLTFYNNTIQHTAFTDEDVSSIAMLNSKTEYITTDISTTIIPDISTSIIKFDNGIQTQAFTDGQNDKINTNTYKTTGISYYSGMGMTLIGSLHAQNFTSDTINTSHLNNTTSNLQTQITDLSTNTANNSNKVSAITYDISTNTTTIADKSHLLGDTTLYNKLDVFGNATFYNPISLLKDVTIGNNVNLLVGASTISRTELSHLDGVTSNIQNQITNLNSNTSAITYDISTNTTAIADHLATSIFECDSGFITNLTCGNINTLHLTSTTSNVQLQLNSTKSQANISTLKLTGIEYDLFGNKISFNSDTSFNSNASFDSTTINSATINSATFNSDTTFNSPVLINMDISQTPNPQFRIVNGTNQLLHVLNCTVGAYNAISQAGDSLILSNLAPLAITSWSDTPTGIRITQTNVEITNPRMKTSFQMVGSSAVDRQINGVGYIDFADITNLSSSNLTQMYHSNNNMTHHNTSPSGNILFYTADGTGTLHRPLLLNSTGLTFKDDTVQTTAFTDTIRDSIPIDKNPTGTILTFAGKMIDVLQSYAPPIGYLWCDGALVSQTTYASLFAVIGQSYRNNKTLVIGSFYVPDLRSAFLKGTWTSPFFPDSTSMYSAGEVQRGNVGWHQHNYIDRGNSGKSVASATGVSTSVANDTQSEFQTSNAYKLGTQTEMEEENRPNCVGVNYIIKC